MDNRKARARYTVRFAPGGCWPKGFRNQAAYRLGLLHEQPNARLPGTPPMLHGVARDELQIRAKKRIAPNLDPFEVIFIGALVFSWKPRRPFNTEDT